jgi:hypothetical protein
MLKSKSVAKLIENLLNQNNKQEHFRVVYEVGSYKGTAINCIFKQGKGTITPIANYTNVRTPYSLEVVMSTQCGEDRIDSVVDIINDMIYQLNGKVEDIDKGKAVFLISPLEIGNYETRATVGQSIIIKVDFSVEYSTSSGTKYEMTLINTQFDDGSINTRYFKTREEQIEWFESKIQDEGVGYSEVLTPNINSLVLTSQRFLNANGLDVNELLLKNYAIIRETKTDGSVKYYYYYVTNANIGDYNLITVDLKMDSLQTHYIDLQFGDCFIDRYHINRWKENEDGTICFNNTEDSDLFETEGINLPKRLTKRTRLKVKHCSIDEANNWLDENIAYWVYVFIDKNKKYKISKGANGEMADTPANISQLVYRARKSGDNILEEYGIVAYPIYKTDREIIVKMNNKEFRIESTGLNDFRLNNTDASYFYGIKYSLICPLDFDLKYSGLTYGIDGNNNLVIEWNKTESSYIVRADWFNLIMTSPLPAEGSVRTLYGLVMGCKQRIEDLETEDYDLDIKTSFLKSEIVGSDRNKDFNPKLLSEHYRKLIIKSSNGEEFVYDIQKLNSNKMNFLYTEPIQSEITRYYYRVKAPIGLYKEGSNTNYLGLVGCVDNSRAYVNNQYSQFLANNKNFYLQNASNRISDTAFGIGQSVFGAVVGGLTGALVTGGNPVGAVVGAGASLISSTTNIIKSETTSKRNENYTIDNMKNAPSTLSNANGNVIFNNFVTDMGLYVEEHSALDNEVQDSDDYMYMNGYTFGRVGNIKDCDNLRHYFNFIQARVENIIGDISNPIREDIRQRFANGVRFWNDDNIQYEKENYERWLNNE